MITIPDNPDQTHRTAVFRSLNDGWSVLLGEIKEGAVLIEETRTFSNKAHLATTGESEAEPNDKSEIDSWLEEKNNPNVLVLLPAAQTISRVLDLSETETEEQVDQELRLKAESHLLGGAPAHRVGMAALPIREGQPRQGILVSWPATSSIEPPSYAEGVSYVPDTAALLGMLPIKPTAQALIHADQSSGSVAIVLDSSEGLLVRSTREQMLESDSWSDSIIRMVMETAIAGHETTEHIKMLKADLEESLSDYPSGEEDQEILLVPETAQKHLKEITSGTEDDSESWWKDWGLSIGAMLANAGELNPLTRLQLRKKAESLSPLGEMAKHFSTVKVMAMMLVAVFVAATFIPIFAAWVRLSVVEGKVDDIQSLKASLTNFEQQRAVYREMSGRSWPMTKLLGDLANCIPLGIEADAITITEGDAVTIRGRSGRFQGASPVQLIQEAMRRMESTKVFGEITFTSDPEDSSGLIKFMIRATVSDPYRNVRQFAQDFGETPHVRLRYPDAFEEEEEEEGSETSGIAENSDELVETTTLADSSSSTTRSRDVGARSSTSSNSTRARSSNSRPPVPTGATSSGSSSRSGSTPGRRSEQTAARSSDEETPIPDSLTDNEIAAMSRAELLKATSQVAKARQRSDLDEETSERLRSDFTRLIEATKNAARGGN